MSVKPAAFGKGKFVAYEATSGEIEEFETFEDAEAFLEECNDEGISEETEQGLSFIARITHRSAMDITDRKENYHKHNDACPEDCAEEEWPYDTDYDVVGRMYMQSIDESIPPEPKTCETCGTGCSNRGAAEF